MEPSIMSGPAARRVFLSVLSFAAAVAVGCVTSSTVSELPLVLSVSLDREQYDVGEPVVVTVGLENRGRRAVDVPRFDAQSLKFMAGLKGVNTRVYREPVASAEVEPQGRQVKPGEAATRQFLFTRLSEQEGEYALLVSLKGIVVKGELLDDVLYATPVPFRVTSRVSLRRDPVNGMILKEQAVEIARKSVVGEVKETRAVLVPLGDSGLFTWLVMLRAQTSDGKEKRSVIQVDPYTGRVRPLELKQPAEGAPGGRESGAAPAEKAAPAETNEGDGGAREGVAK